MSTIIGIDPGSSTGIALMENGRLVVCKTIQWEEDGSEVRTAIFVACMDRKDVLVVIERPGVGIYPRPGQSARAMMRIARSVGQLQERTSQLSAYCRALGCEVREVPPARGGTKRAWTPDAWRAAFAWSGRLPSNHARDAALLAMRASQDARLLLSTRTTKFTSVRADE